MRIRKVSVGVVFRKFPGGIKFLVLRRKRDWKGWEFPKGGVEKGETFREAALREVKEEAGLQRIKITGRIGGTTMDNYPRQYAKKRGFDARAQRAFLVRAFDHKVRVEKGVFAGFRWLGAEDAIKRLKWDNQRKLIRLVLKGRRQEYC